MAFQIMMFTVAGLLIYPWSYAGLVASAWSMYLGVLPFLTCALIMGVAMAPNFRQDFYTCNAHMTCAKVCAGTALTWVAVVCWQIMWIIPAWILVLGGIAHLTKTAKSGRDWWLEMCAFGPTFTAVLYQLILAL